VENVPLRLRDLVQPGGKLGAALGRADIVFDIGGGDSFADIYGFKRFFTTWVTKYRGNRAGVPLILSPQTIGPFDHWWSRPLARQAMNRARLVVTRDAPSTRFLDALGVTAPRLEATDVAMRLPFVRPEREPGARVRVGLNVSGLLFNGGYTQSNQFGLSVDYPALIRSIIGHFAAMPEVEVHLIGHVQSEAQPVEDDQRVAERLSAEFPGVIVAPVFRSPVEAKTCIAGMDFFMGARMHATIAAFSAGVPVVPMAYSRKFAGVFGSLGYTRVADCKGENADAILARIRDGFAARETLKTEIAAAMKNVDARLDAYAARASEELRRAVTGCRS
jgi:polysaccharide pyruvyl transferase WcaK-like protein